MALLSSSSSSRTLSTYLSSEFSLLSQSSGVARYVDDESSEEEIENGPSTGTGALSNGYLHFVKILVGVVTLRASEGFLRSTHINNLYTDVVNHPWFAIMTHYMAGLVL